MHALHQQQQLSCVPHRAMRQMRTKAWVGQHKWQHSTHCQPETLSMHCAMLLMYVCAGCQADGAEGAAHKAGYMTQQPPCCFLQEWSTD